MNIDALLYLGTYSMYTDFVLILLNPVIYILS